jgi:hypothetical protein
MEKSFFLGDFFRLCVLKTVRLKFMLGLSMPTVSTEISQSAKSSLFQLSEGNLAAERQKTCNLFELSYLRRNT